HCHVTPPSSTTTKPTITSNYLNPITFSTSPIFYFFSNDTATTEIYTLSLHDALPIYLFGARLVAARPGRRARSLQGAASAVLQTDRKSTRLNSSHVKSSYAVFCLKKKIMDMRMPAALLESISVTATVDPSVLLYQPPP